MLDVFDVAEMLVNHIKVHYPDDISIIAFYGSYAQGTATERSDLDFFFIPATSTGYDASIQFVINDISFDFWPISWERAERMAAFEEQATTIIADSRLLYVRTDEDSARFMALREKIKEMRNTKHGLDLLNKAELQLRDVYVHLYKMKSTDAVKNMLFFRTEAYGVLTKVLQALALLNQTYFTKGWGKTWTKYFSYR